MSDIPQPETFLRHPVRGQKGQAPIDAVLLRVSSKPPVAKSSHNINVQYI